MSVAAYPSHTRTPRGVFGDKPSSTASVPNLNRHRAGSLSQEAEQGESVST